MASGAPATGGQPVQQQKTAIHSLTERAGLSGESTPRADEPDQSQKEKKDGKKKRSLFGFGKKKEGVSTDSSTAPSTKSNLADAPPALHNGASEASSTTRSTASPTRGDQPFVIPSSPGRGFSSSPRLSSPAGSQIFERDVGTMTPIQPQSPAIPSHIQTENHIPPVLDASSEAITDDHLDPDSVEIVTHAQHQPASGAVSGAGNSGTGSLQPSMEQLAASWAEDLGPFTAQGSDREQADNASAYGASGDNADIRRLSFISFADVVQAEHSSGGGQAGSRESIHLAGLTSLSANRSPSPIRSPVSSQSGPGTSPPTSNPGSIKGIEMSPSRRSTRGGAGSPISTGGTHQSHGGGEVNIETMSQALRRTGSKDLSGALRSHPASPVEGPSR